MAESSRYWNTNGIGDGATAGFDRDAVADWLRDIWATGGSGVLLGVDNELAATGTASPIAVNTGAAIVYGLYYWNTASVNLTVTTPSGGTTGLRVILRASWSAQTVRLVAVRNTDGVAALPALTQTPGTTYEISLATGTITTGGVISLTDDRSYATFSSDQTQESLDAVTALSVIGRSANTTGQSAAITAGTDAYVLRRSGTSIGFGQIAAGGIADDAITAAKIAAGAVGAAEIDTGAVGTDELAADSVDDTKAGNRVPQFYRRQGGSSTIWNTPGTTTYTPTAVRMQAGCAELSMSAGIKTTNLTIDFPVNFAYVPLIYLNIVDSSSTPANQYTVMVNTGTYSPAIDSFVIMLYRKNSSDDDTVKVNWMAIGPE